MLFVSPSNPMTLFGLTITVNISEAEFLDCFQFIVLFAEKVFSDNAEVNHFSFYVFRNIKLFRTNKSSTLAFLHGMISFFPFFRTTVRGFRNLRLLRLHSSLFLYGDAYFSFHSILLSMGRAGCMVFLFVWFSSTLPLRCSF